MKNRLILLVTAIILVLPGCFAQKQFKSDVTTTKKPWTNLNFNNDPANFRFGIMSDRNGGSRPGIFEEGVKKLNLMQPEFVMCVGDLIAGYSTDTALIKREWSEVNGIISGLKMPFFYLPGNHDITNKIMQKEWEKLYGKRYYSFVYKNTLFITLDSNDDENFNLTAAQTEFVLTTLQKNAAVRWTFIFMHHPIWKYNTDGRFEKIEQALKNRKYTVIAGHEHHYNHTERNESNYYILSTTGAGSKLRGNYFGEFDHISWVTVTSNGPVIANLRLDGILSHDISNAKTEKLATPMVENVNFNHLILCNKGEKFTNGTLYLSFKNPTDTDLEIKLNFFHHHQLQIEKPETDIHLAAGENQILEIPFSAIKPPLSYELADLLRFDWEIKYNTPDYPEFALHGKYQLTLEPGKPEFISRGVNIFVGQTTIGFEHPYKNLETVCSLNNGTQEKYLQPVSIQESSSFAFQLKNRNEEYSAIENRSFEKTEFRIPVEVTAPESGLKYSYYEGNWKSIPNFSNISANSEGVAKNLAVNDLARRQENWGVVYTGFVKIPEDNLYQYMIKADNSCQFFVGDKLVADDKISEIEANRTAVALKKGFYPVKIVFLGNQGKKRLRLFSKINGAEDWTPMGPDHFFHN